MKWIRRTAQQPHGHGAAEGVTQDPKGLQGSPQPGSPTRPSASGHIQPGDAPAARRWPQRLLRRPRNAQASSPVALAAIKRTSQSALLALRRLKADNDRPPPKMGTPPRFSDAAFGPPRGNAAPPIGRKAHLPNFSYGRHASAVDVSRPVAGFGSQAWTGPASPTSASTETSRASTFTLVFTDDAADFVAGARRTDSPASLSPAPTAPPSPSTAQWPSRARGSRLIDWGRAPARSRPPVSAMLPPAAGASPTAQAVAALYDPPLPRTQRSLPLPPTQALLPPASPSPLFPPLLPAGVVPSLPQELLRSILLHLPYAPATGLGAWANVRLTSRLFAAEATYLLPEVVDRIASGLAREVARTGNFALLAPHGEWLRRAKTLDLAHNPSRIARQPALLDKLLVAAWSVEHLDLSGNNLHDSLHRFTFASSPQLRTLKMNGTLLMRQQLRAPGFANLHGLETLELVGSSLYRLNGLHLARMPKLRRLVLSNNFINQAGLRSVPWAQLLALRELHLAGNRLHGGPWLGDLPAALLARLEVLDVSHNPLSLADLRTSALTEAAHLQVLLLQRCQLDDDSVVALRFASASALRHLSLASNDLTAACLPQLLPVLRRLQALEHLDLRGNLLGAEAAGYLIRLAASLPSLTMLDVAGCALGAAGSQALRQFAEGRGLTVRVGPAAD